MYKKLSTFWQEFLIAILSGPISSKIKGLRTLGFFSWVNSSFNEPNFAKRRYSFKEDTLWDIFYLRFKKVPNYYFDCLYRNIDSRKQTHLSEVIEQKIKIPEVLNFKEKVDLLIFRQEGYFENYRTCCEYYRDKEVTSRELFDFEIILQDHVERIEAQLDFVQALTAKLHILQVLDPLVALSSYSIVGLSLGFLLHLSTSVSPFVYLPVLSCGTVYCSYKYCASVNTEALEVERIIEEMNVLKNEDLKDNFKSMRTDITALRAKLKKIS